MKITHYRDKKGKFKRKNKYWAILLLTTLGIFAISVGMALNNIVDADADYVRAEQTQLQVEKLASEMSTRQLEKYIFDLQFGVVTTLEACESGAFNEDDAIIIWDDNRAGDLNYEDKPSIGLMQFKKGTIIYYYDRIHQMQLSPLEATLLALDRDAARELAREIIFDTQGGIFNWSICSESKGLVSKVEVIKEIMGAYE